MDAEGFVSIDELLEKIKTRYPIDKSMILEIANKSDKKRFEVKGDKIRALYGHSIPVNIEFEEDTHVKLLYHGTTLEAASEILKEGLKPMKRKWVHLSPTIETAIEVGKRRTAHPVVLEIDAKTAIGSSKSACPLKERKTWTLQQKKLLWEEKISLRKKLSLRERFWNFVYI
jgi:putative RNA 2'-phosphotransferase